MRFSNAGILLTCGLFLFGCSVSVSPERKRHFFDADETDPSQVPIYIIEKEKKPSSNSDDEPQRNLVTTNPAPVVSNIDIPFPFVSQRKDPNQQYKFRIKWDGQYIPGIIKVSSLKQTTQAVIPSEGSTPSTANPSTGQNFYEPLTIERRVTDNRTFEEWAANAWNYGPGNHSQVSLQDARKEMTIEILNESGQVVLSYKVLHCWVSTFEPFTALDSNGSEALMQRITITNDGWERENGATPEPAHGPT